MGGTQPATNFPSGTRPCPWDYHLMFLNLTTNLCLVQGLSTLRTSPWAPFSRPSFIDTYVVHECGQLKVESNPTLKLTTQATTRGTP
jgi:hypothetical protein